MITISVRALLEKLNRPCRSYLEGSVGSCVTRGHYEVTAVHFISQALEDGKGDLPHILDYFNVDPSLIKSAIQKELKEHRVGNTGKPLFLDALEHAWSESSLNLGETMIRTGAFLLALKRNPSLAPSGLTDLFQMVSMEKLVNNFQEIVAGSSENQDPGRDSKRTPSGEPEEGSALAKFTINFTQMAKDGKIDPVSGSERAVRHHGRGLCIGRISHCLFPGNRAKWYRRFEAQS